MKRLALMVSLIFLLSTAAAQPFVGVFGSGTGLFKNDGSPVIASLGAQAGVYNLLGFIGFRGTAEVSVYPDFGFSSPLADAANYQTTELAGDALLSLGLLGVKGYVGLGGGVGQLAAGGALQGRVVAGAEIYGLFAEILPTYWYLMNGSGTYVDVRARAGFNFSF